MYWHILHNYISNLTIGHIESIQKAETDYWQWFVWRWSAGKLLYLDEFVVLYVFIGSRRGGRLCTHDLYIISMHFRCLWVDKHFEAWQQCVLRFRGGGGGGTKTVNDYRSHCNLIQVRSCIKSLAGNWSHLHWTSKCRAPYFSHCDIMHYSMPVL